MNSLEILPLCILLYMTKYKNFVFLQFFLSTLYTQAIFLHFCFYIFYIFSTAQLVDLSLTLTHVTFTLYIQSATTKTCDLWDISSEWWENITSRRKIYTPTFMCTYLSTSIENTLRSLWVDLTWPQLRLIHDIYVTHVTYICLIKRSGKWNIPEMSILDWVRSYGPKLIYGILPFVNPLYIRRWATFVKKSFPP